MRKKIVEIMKRQLCTNFRSRDQKRHVGTWVLNRLKEEHLANPQLNENSPSAGDVRQIVDETLEQFCAAIEVIPSDQ